MNLALKFGAGFLAYWILRLVGVPIEVFLALFIAGAIGWPIGWFVGTLIGDKSDVDTPLFKAIGWFNLVAWLVPIAGIAVAKLTASVGKESLKSRLFYDGMSILGYALVCLTTALYVHLYKSGTMPIDSAEVATQSPDPESATAGERSFARCPYAAIEQWTAEEVQANCKHEPSEAEMREFQLEQQRAAANRS